MSEISQAIDARPALKKRVMYHSMNCEIMYTKFGDEYETRVYKCSCGSDEAQAELRALVQDYLSALEYAEQIAALRAENEALREALKVARVVLSLYANEGNWVSIGGVMTMQTLGTKWADAQMALTKLDALKGAK